MKAESGEFKKKHREKKGRFETTPDFLKKNKRHARERSVGGKIFWGEN